MWPDASLSVNISGLQEVISRMNPLLSTFLRITLIVAAAIVALIVAVFVLKIVLFAAIIAGVAVGCLFLYRLFRRRSGVPMMGRRF